MFTILADRVQGPARVHADPRQPRRHRHGDPQPRRRRGRHTRSARGATARACARRGQPHPPRPGSRPPEAHSDRAARDPRPHGQLRRRARGQRARPARRPGPARRHHRTERRGQDDRDRRHHGLRPGERAGSCSTVATSARSPRTGAPAPASARTWQSVELFDDLTVAENLLVAAEPTVVARRAARPRVAAPPPRPRRG